MFPCSCIQKWMNSRPHLPSLYHTIFCIPLSYALLIKQSKSFQIWWALKKIKTKQLEKMNFMVEIRFEFQFYPNFASTTWILENLDMKTCPQTNLGALTFGMEPNLHKMCSLFFNSPSHNCEAQVHRASSASLQPPSHFPKEEKVEEKPLIPPRFLLLIVHGSERNGSHYGFPRILSLLPKCKGRRGVSLSRETITQTEEKRVCGRA